VIKFFKKFVKYILKKFNYTIVRIQPSLCCKETIQEKISIKSTGHINRLRLVHIGLHENGNAGDTLLFPVIRALLQKLLGWVEFTLVNVRDAVTLELIDLINTHDGVIIGGGGLFLKDTNYNQISGWQWACSLDLLEKIKVPIVVFAVGYNRFREQEEFDEIFYQNISLLVQKSAFFSLRNRGSINKIKNYIDPSLHSKLIFQPCPTTLLSRFYPYEKEQIKNGKTMALNIPFDRSNLRYFYQESSIFKYLSEAIREMEAKEWNVVLYNNINRSDSEASSWFNKYGISLPQLNLQGMPPSKVIYWYNNTDAVIGGRGHAQMIPFGLNIPIFSLISHDKLGWFLEDIGHPEWGVEILSPLLKDKIINFVNSIQDENYKKYLLDAQDSLWQLTIDNIAKISEIFGISHNVNNLKNIVDSAYSPYSKNAEMLFLQPESLLKL